MRPHTRAEAEFRAQRTTSKYPRLRGPRRNRAIMRAIRKWMANNRRSPGVVLAGTLGGDGVIRDVLVGAGAILLGNMVSKVMSLTPVPGYLPPEPPK